MNIDKKIKIGFFGEPGSNTEQAARGFFGPKETAYGMYKFKAEYLPFLTISDLLGALAKKQIEKAVLPIENSIEGVVTSSTDALINGNGIVIEDEVILRIRHNLIGVGSIHEVRKVISHPQALAQCGKYIEKLPYIKGLSVEKEASGSTSAAVKEVAEKNDLKVAAIGPMSAFEVYKSQNSELKILAENIQDVEKNQTRFFILGHEKKSRTGKDKTSIIFGVEDKSGSLVDVLLVFKVIDINMTQIISRPSKKKLGEYLFWVDIDGHRDEKTVQVALGQIGKITTVLRVLGSYPKA